MSTFFQPNKQSETQEKAKTQEHRSEPTQLVEKRSIFAPSNECQKLPAWADFLSKPML